MFWPVGYVTFSVRADNMSWHAPVHDINSPLVKTTVLTAESHTQAPALIQ